MISHMSALFHPKKIIVLLIKECRILCLYALLLSFFSDMSSAASLRDVAKPLSTYHKPVERRHSHSESHTHHTKKSSTKKKRHTREDAGSEGVSRYDLSRSNKKSHQHATPPPIREEDDNNDEEEDDDVNDNADDDSDFVSSNNNNEDDIKIYVNGRTNSDIEDDTDDDKLIIDDNKTEIKLEAAACTNNTSDRRTPYHNNTSDTNNQASTQTAQETQLSSTDNTQSESYQSGYTYQPTQLDDSRDSSSMQTESFSHSGEKNLKEAGKTINNVMARVRERQAPMSPAQIPADRVYGNGTGYRPLERATAISPDGKIGTYEGNVPPGKVAVVTHSGRPDNGSEWGKHVELRDAPPLRDQLTTTDKVELGMAAGALFVGAMQYAGGCAEKAAKAYEKGNFEEMLSEGAKAAATSAAAGAAAGAAIFGALRYLSND